MTFNKFPQEQYWSTELSYNAREGTSSMQEQEIRMYPWLKCYMYSAQYKMFSMTMLAKIKYSDNSNILHVVHKYSK